MSNLKQNSFSNRYFIIIITILTIILFTAFLVLKPQTKTKYIFLIILLVFSFLFLIILTNFWLKYKLDFKSDNELDKNGKTPSNKILLASFYFSSFYFISILILIYWYINSITASSYIYYLLLLFITLNNLILLIQFNGVFKQLERPNAYIFKFLNKMIGDLSNDFETTFALKILSIILVFILPLIAFYFLTKEFIISYVIITIIINILVGGYWIGYGLYKQLIWIWGFQSDLQDKSTKKQKLALSTIYNNFKYKEGKRVFLGFIFLIFSTLLLVGLVIRGFLFNSTFQVNLAIPIFILYLLFLYGISVDITGKRTVSQPWYSILFTMYTFSIPFNFIFSYFYVFNSEKINIFPGLISSSIVFREIILGTLIISILLAFITNNRYLSFGVWKNHYEANQILNGLAISQENPSIIQLNLLQKLGNLMEDRETILKLVATYKEILELENKKIKNELFTNIYFFINNQLSIDADDEIYELLFNLANQLLDVSPNYDEKLFEVNIQLLRNGNSAVKNGSLNVLGHILQLNPDKDYANKIYNEIEKIYHQNDEKLKRLVLDALMYFIKKFPEYTSRIKDLISGRLEYETFGIATIIFSLLDEIYQINNDEEIYLLAKNTLESLDSPAKLGAINFLRNNFPTDQDKKKTFIKILLDNLKDIDNAIGIRTNCIYALNDSIRNDKEQSYLLSEIRQYINDFDPDVKSAVIQSFTEQFILRNTTFSEVMKVFEQGMEEHDYIVRLVVIQSIKLIKQHEKILDDNFIKIVKKATSDESQAIQNEAFEILNT